MVPILLIAALLAPQTPASTPLVVPLWEKGAPGFEARKSEPEKAASYWVKSIHNPSVTVFLPPKEKATGAAIIIAPGGGHRELVFNAEGVDAAKYLASQGVAAFALKYRLAREEGSPYSLDIHPRQDAQRAIRLVRSRAKEWGVDPKRIGMLGFSAGGEVVSVAAYGKSEGDPAATDPIDRESAKLDFQMLVYPGPLGIPETIPPDAPPGFFLVANDDGATRNIVTLINKFRQAKVSLEAHIYAQGQHAFNMGNRSKLTSIKTWPQRMTDWLSDNGWLTPKP